MKVYREINITEFKFWSGGKSTVELLTLEEMRKIQYYLEDLEEDGFIHSETDLNDFFWFDTDWIANFLGYENFEALYKERKH